MGLSWILTGCTPPSLGTWQIKDPAAQTVADLRIQSCRFDQACTIALTSFSKQTWSFAPNDAKLPCSVWLDETGRWVDAPPKSALLELWLGGSSSLSCTTLGPRPTYPRWMLLPQPVEAARNGGMGTRRPRFTLSRQRPAVKHALIHGHVDGVLSLGQGETELLLDLEQATIRSGRQWLELAVFSLIFGRNAALGPPEIGLAARSHRPELWSDRPGLALEFRGLRTREHVLIMQVHDKTQTATFKLPRIALQHQALGPRAHVEPCLDCGPRRQTGGASAQ